MSGTNSDFTFDFSKFLPAVNQTSTLVKFFGATVNQVFQPGASATVSGYIGEVPTYNNPNTDFYVSEPTEERSAYQLEPAMVSFTKSSNTSTISNALTYPDFVAYLMNTSAITGNQPRLFENKYFTWAPPIDIDKLVNYNQYRWFGNSQLPALTVTTPVGVYTASAGQTNFNVPVVPHLAVQHAAFVNGSVQSSTYNKTTGQIILASGANAGDQVVVTVYNNLDYLIRGQQTFDLSMFVNYSVTHVGDGFTQAFDAFTNPALNFNAITIAVYYNGDLIGYINNDGFTQVGSNDIEINIGVNPAVVKFATSPNGVSSSEDAALVTIVTYNGLSAVLNAVPPSSILVDGISGTSDSISNYLLDAGIAVLAPSITTGMIAGLFDTQTLYIQNNIPKTYFIDNVGSSARLTPTVDLLPVFAPQYITIDRSSIDQNAWSLHNFWVHIESFAWSGSISLGIAASRPIIEFVKDIVIYNYGLNRVEIDAIMTTTTASWLSGGMISQISLGQINYKNLGSVSVDNSAIFTPSPGVIEEHGNYVLGGDVNEFGNTQDSAGIENVYAGEVDETGGANDKTDITGLQGIILRAGMTLLVINDQVNQLFTVRNDGSGGIQLIPVNNSNQGDYFTSPQYGIFGGQDIHYNSVSNSWVIGEYQEWSESVAPLFYLFNADETGIQLDDASMYPDSNFAGSEIFSYAVGTGVPDSVLLQPLQYDANGYIVFENKTVTNRYTYNGGAITGLYCYGTYIKTISTSVNENANLLDFSNGGLEQEDAPPNYYADASDYGNAQDATDALTTEIAFIYHTTNSLWLPSPNITEQAVGSSFPGIPPNLQANPLSQDVSFVSLSDWNEQFTEILENQVGFTGNTFSANNYRDTAKNLALGTQIVQHQAPMLKSMLISSAEEFDLQNAIRFVELEYRKFKNKFVLKIVDISNRGLLINGVSDDSPEPNDPSNWITSPYTWVMTALNEIKANMNSTFPFSLSTMAGGNYFIAPTPAFLGVMPSTIPMFVTDNTYTNQTLFIRGHDGSYVPAYGSLDGNGFSTDWRDYVLLELEMLIYNNILNIIENNSGATALNNFIQERLNFDVQAWMNNIFYQVPAGNGYLLSEVTQMLSSSFQQWVQQGKYDYRTYGGYDQNNPFTWNFSSVKDRFGNSLPGNWRGIYNLYFDTDHPHTRPWEMLGFADIPDWWIGYYGNFYGRTNTNLWHDLEAGYIAQGPRQGNDPRYARPGLSRFIPVDAYANLLDPIKAGIVPVAPTQFAATRDWVFGDWAPVEAVWRSSSSYKFALSELGFLMKPPQFVEILWDTANYGYSGPQWVDFRTLNRPSSATDLLHGELNALGNPTVVIGIQQWLVDGLVNIGKSAPVLGSAIRNIDVRLVHQMASFISNDGLKAISDTFGLLPSEDVQIALYNAPAFDTETYSGVIVEWTGNGYRVVGYDNQNPYFTVLPPNTAGPKSIISIASSPEQIPFQWRQSVYYTSGIKVIYENFVYECDKSHTSGSTFDDAYWTLLGQQPKIAPRVTSYNLALPTAMQIPYGTVFPNIQAVSDFMLGWQNWLVSRGWVFDQIDTATQLTRDWALAVKEFLGWSQVSWAPGNFIALSPGAEQLNFVSQYGTVLNVEDAITGFFGLLDRSGNPISSRNAYISRFGSQITLEANSADIYCSRLRIAEVEHILVFSNTTIFNDILYIPLFNLKQARLKLIANVSTDWNGRLSAPGFVLVGNDLVPNFEKNAEDIRTMFDIEKTDRTDLLSYARHNIGYQARTYMEDLLLSDTEQFEFFQGMIQAKGSPGVFERLLRSTRINENSDIEFLEEWAIRQCHFGAPFNPRITLTLPQNEVRADPQFVVFSDIANASPIWLQVPIGDALWLDAPVTQTFFPISTASPVLPSAGPVRLSEVQYTSFSPTDLGPYFTSAYDSNLSVFNTGERVWVYNDNNTWNVLRVFDLGLQANPITQIATPTEDPTVTGMRIYFQYPLAIQASDVGNYVVINNSTLSTPDLIGMQTITGYDISGQWIEVDQQGSLGYTFTGTVIQPVARVLRTVRFANTAALNATIVYAVYETGNLTDFADTVISDSLDDYTSEYGNLSDSTDISTAFNLSYWNVGDIVWIDNDSDTGLYAVRVWDGDEFVVIRNQPVRVDSGAIITSTIYEATSQIVNATVLTGQQSNQNAQLVSDQPLIDNLVVVDPIAGFVPGVAEREITFRTEVDPAMYNSGPNFSTNPWGANQVGQVWWDLSTCRFLDYYTDLLGVTNQRDIAEITHRIQNWAMIAPNASVDVYEWVQSSMSPFDWASSNTGTVYNAATPSYVQQSVYSAQFGTFVNVYFFWAKGITTVPNVSFRKTDISTVASILTNPSSIGTPWIAPIMPNGLIVSGVQSSLDNTSSALMVEVSNGVEDKTHAEWILIDQNDSLSLPPPWLWRNIRDSLGGFQNDLSLLPDPSLSSYRNTGIYPGQNMFSVAGEEDSVPQGLLDARESYVGMINNILARSPTVINNAAGVFVLNQSDTFDGSSPTYNEYLSWSRQSETDPVIPPPAVEYDIVVYDAEERNRLILTDQFQNALTNNGPIIRIAIDGTATSYPFWSIWVFDPTYVNILLATRPPGLDPIDYMYQNAVVPYPSQSIFTLATSYDVSCATYANMLTGIYTTGTIASGDRIYVMTDETADGFWTIYLYNGGAVNNPSSYSIHRAQLFRTSDFIETVDWYAQDITINNGSVLSYSAANPPTVSYATTSLRDRMEGTTNNYTIPNNQFVSISTAGTSQFQWTVFDTTVVGNTVINGVTLPVYTGWTIVAQSGGTIALSSNFYASKRTVYGLSSPPVLVNGLLPINNRDGSWEIRVLVDALNNSLLTNAQQNEVFFSIVHFVHTQQNSVDWIFKTSFMTVGGFAIPLGQNGIVVEDPTAALVDYINEVKPYRVKIRDYSQQYSIGLDQANVIATDFDLPVYFDTTFNQYLPIIGTVADGVFTLAHLPYPNLAGGFAKYSANVATVLGEYPWSDWEDNFLAPASTVRRNTIKLLFDRIIAQSETGYDIPNYSTVGFDNGDEYGTVYVSWQANAAYSVGQIVNYNGNNYECSTANTRTVFNILDWTLLDNSLVNETAANRIANYYDGTAINTVLTFSYGAPDVMNIRQKGNEIDANSDIDGDYGVAPFDTEGYDGTVTAGQSSIVDGGVMDGSSPYVVSINAPTSDQNRAISDTQTVKMPNGTFITIPLGGVADPLGYGLRDPYIDANVPEERIPLIVDDTVLFSVTTGALAGSPVQSAKVYDVSTSVLMNSIFGYGVIPESNDAVLVFRDGLLASQATGDYTVDQIGRKATIQLVNGPTRYKTIHVHAFGTGSTAPMQAQYFLSGTGSRTYELNSPIAISYISVMHKKKKGGGTITTGVVGTLQVGVTVGGVRNDAWTIGLDQSSIVFNTAPAEDEDVVIKIGQEDYENEACVINHQILPYKASKSWTLANPDTITTPIYAGTLVYVNGQRLMPPLAYYGAFTDSTSLIQMDASPGGSTQYVIYWNNDGNIVEYTLSVPLISSLTQTDGASNDPQFAFLHSKLVSQNSNFVTNYVSVTVFIGNQYKINGAILKISSTLSPSDVIEVISFSNATAMVPQTYTYGVRSSGQYPILVAPATNEYALISYNGLTLSPDSDYQFTVDDNGNPVLQVPNITGSDYIVATIYAGEPYRGSVNWLAATNTPAAIRMAPQRWANLTAAEQGSVDEPFTYTGNFVNYLSFLGLDNNTPDADTIYTLTVNSVPYIDDIPIITALPTKTNGAPDDPQFAFYGSSLISLNYNFVADDVSITIEGIPVPIFANLDGWAGLIPYYPDDTNPYDHAVLNQEGDPQPMFVYDMLAAWENTKVDVLHTGLLVNDLLLTDTSLILNLVQQGVSPKLYVQNPFFIPTPNDPGVLWVDGERIEYQNCVYNPSNPTQVTINGLRRATHGTSIPENRIVQTSTTPVVSPYQTAYVLQTISTNLANGIVEVVMNTSDGRNLFVPATEYSVNIVYGSPNIVTVTLINPTDAFYVVSLTLPLSHSIGSTVYNGNQIFGGDVPFGPEAGDRYLEPLNYVENING
jgi:hypothetical protein